MFKKSAHKSITHTSFFQLVLLCALAISVGTFLYLASPKKLEIAEPTPQPTLSDLVRNGIEKCGEIPKSLPLKNNEILSVGFYGPLWSPGCKYIVYSIGTWINESGIEDFNKEGVWLYSSSTKRINKIYIPKKRYEQTEIKDWKSKTELLFTSGRKDYIYDVNIKNTSAL